MEGYLRARGGGVDGRPHSDARWMVQTYLAPDLVVREMEAALRESLQQEPGRALGRQITLVHCIEQALMPLAWGTSLQEELDALVGRLRDLAVELYRPGRECRSGPLRAS